MAKTRGFPLSRPQNSCCLWSYTANNPFLGVRDSPAVVDGRVYIGSDQEFYCLDAVTGAFIWNYTTNNFIESSPAVANGKVYIGINDGKVYCLNALSGALIWS